MEKINIAEILKNCPQGMELDCSMWDNVTLGGIDSSSPSYPIEIKIKGDKTTVEYLTKFGEWDTNENSKCVIFPKGKTTWEGFQKPFKDGDIIATDLGSVFILKSCLEDKIHYHSYIGLTCCDEIQEKQMPFAYKHVCHLANEEEKQKLFQAIKANGYYWNPDTKTLEKLAKPKFKTGDKIVKKNDVYAPILIANVDNEFYYFNTESSVGILPISDQDGYELFPNKFDINALKPFESKVLVRDADCTPWYPSFWGYYEKRDYLTYNTVRGFYNQCIPYEGNENLLGTTYDCDEYYKTWK